MSKFVAPLQSIACWLLLPALWSPLGAVTDDSTPYVFTTLAGASSIGSTDGPAAAARFFEPTGIAVDLAGNLYVADTENHTIRKISAAGIVTTLAGAAGYPGATDGAGSAARFSFPESIAVDPAGNLYVADTGNYTVRKIAPDGLVSTLAGTAGVMGNSNGPGSTARFRVLEGIALDTAGNVYVADGGNYMVRKITPLGIVSTLAGTGVQGSVDGPGSAAKFNHTRGLARDAAGNLYVTEHNKIRKITPLGVVSTFAQIDGTAAHGTGYLTYLGGITVDAAGYLYVVDTPNATVLKISPEGVVSAFAGSPVGRGSTDGIGSAARFLSLACIAVDTTGNVFVADEWNNTIRKITPATAVTTVAGLAPDASIGTSDGTAVQARFGTLLRIATGAGGEVYVADTDNHTIRKVSPGGEVTTIAGTAGIPGSADGHGNAARFNHPTGLAVDAADNLYVADTGNHTIRMITPSGTTTTVAGLPGADGSQDGIGSAAQFSSPSSIAVDTGGNLYVADTDIVRKISPDRVVTTLPSTAGLSRLIYEPYDSQAVHRYYETIEGLAVDAIGNLYASYQMNYVSPSGPNYYASFHYYMNSVIREFSPDGTVTIRAGIPFEIGTTIVGGSAGGFYRIHGVAVDHAGNLYAAVSGSHTICKITPAGEVSTLAGLNGAIGSAAGVGRAARFEFPTDIALDASDNIYVSSGSTVRQGRLAGPPVITTQPQSLTVAAGGSVQFSVSAHGTPDPTFQWFLNGAPFSGATGNTLSFANARTSDAGDYTVVVTNALGSVTSNKVTLAVTTSPTPPPPPAQPSGGGGGGGAPSPWFALALLALAALRRLTALRPA